MSKVKSRPRRVIEVCDALTPPLPTPTPAAKATPPAKPKPAPKAKPKPKRAAEATKPPKPAPAKKPAPRKPVAESTPIAAPMPNYSDPDVFAAALDAPVGIGIAMPRRSIFIGAPIHWD